MARPVCNVADDLRSAVTRVLELLPHVTREGEDADEDHDPPPLPPPIVAASSLPVSLPSTSRGTSYRTMQSARIPGSSSNTSLTGIERIGSACTRAVSTLRTVRCQAEQRLNFTPYVTPKKSKPLSFKFYCLQECNSVRVPTSSILKESLIQCGLGIKELLMDPSLTARELRDRVVEAFPPLSKAGGFELLRCISNTRDLEVIPYSFTISPQHLKAYMGKGKVFIRPLQADLTPTAQEYDEINEECLRCHSSIPISVMREHLMMFCNKRDDESDTHDDDHPPSKKLRIENDMLEKNYCSLEEVISDLEMNFSFLEEYEEISVSRDNLLKDAMLFIENHHNVPYEFHVSFEGECGVDAGGLQREFWTLLGNQIVAKFFEGEEGSCVLKRNVSSLLNNEYLKVGKLLALGVSKGYSFPFMAQCTYDYICGSDPLNIDCNIECIASQNIRDQVKMINNASNGDELREAVQNSIDLIDESGFTKPIVNLQINDKKDLVHALVLYYCLLKAKAELDQLKEGLKLMGVGLLMAKFKTLFQCLFVGSDVQLTADVLLGVFTVNYSGTGNSREKDTYAMFCSYLHESEANNNDFIKRVLSFFSGIEKLPVFGFDTVPSLHFNKDNLYPTSSTCLLELTLPTRYDEYSHFKTAMNRAMLMHGGFGNV